MRLAFPPQSPAQLSVGQPILERLTVVDEQHGDLHSKARLQVGVAGDVDLLQLTAELGGDRLHDLFHVVAQMALGAGVECELDGWRHASEGSRRAPTTRAEPPAGGRARVGASTACMVTVSKLGSDS